jgi:hypothetical protein
LKIYYQSRTIGLLFLLLSILHGLNIYKDFRELDIFSLSLLLIGELCLIISVIGYFTRKFQKVEVHDKYLLFYNVFTKPVKLNWEDIDLILPRCRILNIPLPLSQVGKVRGYTLVINLFGYKSNLIEEIITRAHNAKISKVFLRR